jgi:hypothetical protein
MGDLYYTLKDGEEFPVEPTEKLAVDGWLPGTWVKYSSTAVTFSGAMATVDRSDGIGVLAGFLKTGTQHTTPVELLSDMWTTDTRQRDGGDTKSDWSAFDASARLEFDGDFQLQRMGTRIVTMFIPPTGFHKFYVYEINNLAERTTPGAGAVLVYTSGDKLYVSSRGRLTNEQESGAHSWTGFVSAKSSRDEEGNYLIVVAAMGD